MHSGDPYLTISLTFRYRHGFGALAPFFEALEEGRAVGTRCPRCSACWFPPRLTCPYDFADAVWCELPPYGAVRQVTHGPGSIPLSSISDEMMWALVQLDGCENSMLARLTDLSGGAKQGARVQLVGDSENEAEHPIQHAVFSPGP